MYRSEVEVSSVFILAADPPAFCTDRDCYTNTVHVSVYLVLVSKKFGIYNYCCSSLKVGIMDSDS